MRDTFIEREVLALRLRAARSSTGAALELRVVERAFRASLDVGSGTLESTIGPLAYWDLEPELAVDWDVAPGAPRDAFVFAAMWGWEAAVDPDGRDADAEPPADDAPAWRRLHGALTWTKRHAHALLDRTLARVARRFRPPERFAVYRHLASDGTGRVAQLATACPGALLFLLGLEARGSAERAIAAHLHASVLAGRRLDRLLDEAVGAFLELTAEDWNRTRGLDATERATVAHEHRLLLRRMGSLVPPRLLLAPLPAPLVPTDVPSAPDRSARWLEGVRRAERRVATSALPHAQATGLLAFVQRHGAEEERLGHLIDYVARTGRVLPRTTRPEAVFAAAYDHHVNAWREAAYPDDLALAAPELPRAHDARLRTRLFRTAGDMRIESERMHHCVASFVEQARIGRGAFGHADIDGEPVTFHLAPYVHGWTLVEAKGLRNRELTAEEQRLLDAWILDLPLPERPIDVLEEPENDPLWDVETLLDEP